MANRNPSPATRFTSDNQPENRGRKTGSRDRISSKFFEDFAAVWEEHGKMVLEKLAIDDLKGGMQTLAKIAASIPPKQVENISPESGLSEDQMNDMIELMKAELTRRQTNAQEGNGTHTQH